jgi:hypothetical protein
LREINSQLRHEVSLSLLISFMQFPSEGDKRGAEKEERGNVGTDVHFRDHKPNSINFLLFFSLFVPCKSCLHTEERGKGREEGRRKKVRGGRNLTWRSHLPHQVDLLQQHSNHPTTTARQDMRDERRLMIVTPSEVRR